MKNKIEKQTGYNYAIIKDNNHSFCSLSTLVPKGNKYKERAKYAMFVKGVHKDGSESYYYIKYSSDIVALQNEANQFPSWYNYPIGISKSYQGYLSEL